LDVYKEWLGIPEGPRPPDHYQLLRLVQFEDDAEKIRKNYTKLNQHVRKYATGKYSVESQVLLNELAKAMLLLTDAERKREYDESLGREFDDADQRQKTMGQVLVEQSLLTRDQLQEAESFAEARGLSMRDALVQMKLVDADTATRAMAREMGRPYVDLADLIPDDDMLDVLPRALVKRNGVLPLFIDGDYLLIACMHDITGDLEDELRLRYGHPIRPVMATPLAVNQAIAKYYAPGMRDEAKAQSSTVQKSSGKAKAKATKGTTAVNEKAEDDPQKRKQMGTLILCFGTMAAVAADQLVIRKFLLPTWSAVYFLSLVIPPALYFYVRNTYWK